MSGEFDQGAAIERLALAVLYRAVLDAQSDRIAESVPALAWLKGEGAAWFDALGWDGKALKDWTKAQRKRTLSQADRATVKQ
jgi:hypothetical protein